ncbi:unnamed protein product [Rotaria sordida]|uniref:Condensation domain-containing protein n=1 Tax=Rotaria sordida TaxID=392033 RepID=A0A815APL0_9BILA|nr:unnamed protein product [Rotaria sordida]CAF1576480.1 unnamed protein product [Rotaria sordida]
MPMTAASMFWLDTLRDYKIDHSLPLPFDRYRLSDEYRTGREMSVSFDFGEDLSHVFLAYSSSNSITALQLALACYYAFLFKLTNGEKDLCIGMNTHGRYKEELMSVIGMFVNTIPLRCLLDPHWSFHQLVEHVKEIITNTLKYSYFPLQRILSQHPNATKPAFIETSFEFQSFKSKSDKKEMMIGNARIIAAPISKNIGEDGIMSNFDFTLTIQHDLDIDQLSCTINASLDLFDRKTIDIITQRFHSMLEQLFNVTDIQMKKPIYEFSLILPNEKFFTKSMNNTQYLNFLGEVLPVKLAKLMRSMVTSTCRVWNLYGPAEITIDCTSHVVDITSDTKSIPIERTLPNYRCLILDSWLQCVFIGYLGRDDLTARALLLIDGEVFYRTGDLVRMDNNGLLRYQGRKDYQIKLHGQRIELGEIEQCLLETSISTCVVIKWGDDHLVAYVQSTDINVEELRKHCQSHLPPHMIPSIFVVLEKLPINANGKIDRKLLPASQFSSLTNIDQTDVILLTPLEEHLKCIFSKAFHNESPNVNMSFGQLGGTSLDAIRALVLIRQEICTKYLLGTTFYNSYLRLCGAKIGYHTHIYTTLIDAPWLLEVGESSFIGEEVVLSRPITSGYYPINSYYYLHKLWLRQLIITSFHQALDFLPPFDVLSSVLLRWLGARIEDDVKILNFHQILRFPSNLLNIERGVTTFGGAKLVSFKMTKEGLCYLDEIHLGSHTNLGSGCTIMPATKLPSETIVGSLTLVTQKTVNTQRTQFLVFLFRVLGAQIGSDVILPDISCLTDLHLVNIGNHVRLSKSAVIQPHTFEQRIYKLAPITVNHSSVLMSNTLVLSGARLQGQNRILPWTLVMKDDQLPPNTNWSGVPAKQVI